MLKILGIVGSLREGSYHKALLKEAQKLVPEGSHLEIFEALNKIPPFNQDREADPPKVITDFKDKIQSADAILIASPEYNYSVPGVLKNAIDWASRPYGNNSWEAKPVAIMSASVGIMGGARAQYHLRQTFVFLNMYPLNRPEVIIPLITEKFDEDMQLEDEHTKEKIHELLQALVNWTIKLAGQDLTISKPREKYQYETAYNEEFSGTNDNRSL